MKTFIPHVYFSAPEDTVGDLVNQIRRESEIPGTAEPKPEMKDSGKKSIIPKTVVSAAKSELDRVYDLLTSGEDLQMNPDGTLNCASMQTITNPDDLNAIEAALTLKDETGCEVVVVSMGPPPAEGMLRELLARGADRAVLVSAREFGGSDTFATSQILAAAIKKIGVEKGDIVFCGRQAIDGDTAQVGPQIAEKLGMPQITYVSEIKVDGEHVICRRMLEDGYMTIKTHTPCLLTCIKELNTPRYMSVGGIFECYNKPLEVYNFETLKDDPLIELDTIGLKGSPTNVYKSFSPPQKGAGMMLEGADKATCEKLADILAKKHII